MSHGAEITLQNRGLCGQQERVLQGVIRDGRHRRPFCLKWCPGADPDALERTYTRMKWWRERHPELAASVVDILGVWPDEQLMLLDWRPGNRLGRHLKRHFPFRREGAMWWRRLGRDVSARRSPGRRLRQLDVDQLGTELGDWLCRFAAGHVNYGPEVDPLLGLCAGRRPDGRLFVDARHLLEQRVERGEQAEQILHRAGLSSSASLTDGFDINGIIGSFGREEAGGFIHGDFKPDNILVHDGGWSVVDWWMTPRVSWPLADVATFAGNLWFYGAHRSADRLWRAFSAVYLSKGCDERTSQAIDLVSTIMRLTVIADKLQRPVIGKRLAQRWCKRLAEHPSPLTHQLLYSRTGSRRTTAQKAMS